MCPATVRLPFRVPLGFTATLNTTDPLAWPETPLLMEIQGELLTAVHAHPAPAVTATVREEPPSGTSKDSGVALYVQPEA